MGVIMPLVLRLSFPADSLGSKLNGGQAPQDLYLLRQAYVGVRPYFLAGKLP